MKLITFHPASVLAGAALTLAALVLAAAQSPAVESVLHPSPRQVEMKIAGVPDPNDMVVIRQEDGAFTVPAGMILVITGLGSDQLANNCLADLVVDGILVAQAGITNFSGPGAGFIGGGSIQSTQPIRIEAGSSVAPSISCSPAVHGRAIGYLARARP